jgi:acetylornithine deacetylase
MSTGDSRRCELLGAGKKQMNVSALDKELSSYVEKNGCRLFEILQDLVRIPSENTAPTGGEGNCQEYIANFLSGLGCDPLVYLMENVPGLQEHPVFWPGRDYRNRPNVGARMKGTGNGRSLLLSGHIDTVPVGSAPWTRDPFGGTIEGNLLYGRGAADMKCGIATNLFVIECLRKLKIELAGDVVFESVVDEEFGGVNGTLAGRLKGFNADAVVLSEPSFLRICPAQRGGRIAHLTLKSSGGGILHEGAAPPGVMQQLAFLMARIDEFGDQRRVNAEPHELYRSNSDPVPVAITKVITAPWGTSEPMTIPQECKVEIYWQAMPGERQEDIDREFFQWIESLSTIPGSPFMHPPEVEFPVRWLPGSAISKQEPLVTELADCATRILGKPPALAGIEGPCDMFVFHNVQHTPAVLWGARGGNTHAPDEYVELDTLIDAAKVLLAFTCQWCAAR